MLVLLVPALLFYSLKWILVLLVCPSKREVDAFGCLKWMLVLLVPAASLLKPEVGTSAFGLPFKA